MLAGMLPSVDVLPGVLSGTALSSCRPGGVCFSLKWGAGAPPVSEYTAIVCRPFAQRDVWLAGRTGAAEAARPVPPSLRNADGRNSEPTLSESLKHRSLDHPTTRHSSTASPNSTSQTSLPSATGTRAGAPAYTPARDDGLREQSCSTASPRQPARAEPSHLCETSRCVHYRLRRHGIRVPPPERSEGWDTT
jgi:hypothetical protein